MITNLCAASLLAVSMMLAVAGCSVEAPSEPNSTSVATPAVNIALGTCRYICTRVVGGNEYQIDDTDPNNSPNRCTGNNQCNPPASLTCATPGLVANTPCTRATIDD